MKILKLICESCGGNVTKHQVLESHITSRSESFDDEYGNSIEWGGDYQILECLGCESIRFRQSIWCSEDMDPATGEVEHSVSVYPEFNKNHRQSIDTWPYSIPSSISPIYSETIKAINSGINTLAAGGLRATVEAVCRELGVNGDDLFKKIENLEKKGHLGKTQSEFLHELRFLGNLALHEMHTPKREDIRNGLDIIEAMLNSIYILPLHVREVVASK